MARSPCYRRHRWQSTRASQSNGRQFTATPRRYTIAIDRSCIAAPVSARLQRDSCRRVSPTAEFRIASMTHEPSGRRPSLSSLTVKTVIVHRSPTLLLGSWHSSLGDYAKTFQSLRCPISHEPLMLQETFDEAQAVLGRKPRARYPRQRYPFMGLLTCARCGCSAETCVRAMFARQGHWRVHVQPSYRSRSAAGRNR